MLSRGPSPHTVLGRTPARCGVAGSCHLLPRCPLKVTGLSRPGLFTLWEWPSPQPCSLALPQSSGRAGACRLGAAPPPSPPLAPCRLVVPRDAQGPWWCPQSWARGCGQLSRELSRMRLEAGWRLPWTPPGPGPSHLTEPLPTRPPPSEHTGFNVFITCLTRCLIASPRNGAVTVETRNKRPPENEMIKQVTLAKQTQPRDLWG